MHRIRIPRPPSGPVARTVRLARPDKAPPLASPHAVRIARAPSPPLRAARATPKSDRIRPAHRRKPHRATARRWRRHARKAQVAPIATILGLLLVVVVIANYLTTTLPGQVATNELGHEVEVGNQLGQLQAAIGALATQSAGSSSPLIPFPITLGSDSVPPFAGSSPGLLSVQPAYPNASRLDLNFQHIGPAPIDWRYGNGNQCYYLPSSCAGNVAPQDGLFVINVSNQAGKIWQNPLTLDVKSGGSCGKPTNSCSVFYNITLSHYDITLDLLGEAAQNMTVVLLGNWDNLTFHFDMSKPIYHTIQFFIFGLHDTYSARLHYAPSGVTPPAIPRLYVNTTFADIVGSHCPGGNGSNTDTTGLVHFSPNSGTYMVQNFTWWNNAGYTTPLHSVQPRPPYQWFVDFQNMTGALGCPFTLKSPMHPQIAGPGTLLLQLENRQLPVVTYGVEDGAVVERQQGGISEMLIPPLFKFGPAAGGNLSASLVMPVLVGPAQAVSGVGDSAIQIRVLGVETYQVVNGTQGNTIDSVSLTVWTAFPSAWLSYFRSASSQVFPHGATCFATLYATCHDPPSGQQVRVVAPMYVDSITVTLVIMSVVLI